MTQPPSVEPPAPITRVTAAVPSAKGWTMFEENGQDEVGVVVDQRFEILARIGDGGMAKYRRQRQPETPPRELLQAALGLDLPDALLVLRVSELPNPEPAVRAAAAALAAAEAEDAGPEEFA